MGLLGDGSARFWELREPGSRLRRLDDLLTCAAREALKVPGRSPGLLHEASKRPEHVELTQDLRSR